MSLQMPSEPADQSRGRVLLITMVRYALGLVILIYGISKLSNYQFQVSAWDYDQPLIRASGSMLTWAFLGYQPWFQFLLGVFETMPGLLLLSRRTWRLGALMLFPVLLNVVLMNFAMELWLNTRIISSVLLLLNLILLACDLPMYRAFLAALLPAPAPFRNSGTRVAATITSIALPILALGTFIALVMLPQTRAIEEMQDFVGVRQINGAGAWGVDRIAIGGHELTGEPKRRFYFDIFRECAFKSGSEEAHGTFKANRRLHMIDISNLQLAQSSGPIAATYTLDSKILRIEGMRAGEPVEIVLHRLNWGPTRPWGP